MMTTKYEAKVILRKVGLRGEWKRTGHPDWERCFIKKDGVTYGRQSYLNGVLYSTKWYGTNGIEFEVFCIEMLIGHNFLPTREQYNLTWYWAEKAASLEYARKEAARYELPFKKRKSLAPPNPAKWFRRIFEYKWIIFGGLV